MLTLYDQFWLEKRSDLISGVNNTALVIEFADCVLRAAANGIEGLVPSHNPLHIRDIDITKEFLGIE